MAKRRVGSWKGGGVGSGGLHSLIMAVRNGSCSCSASVGVVSGSRNAACSSSRKRAISSGLYRSQKVASDSVDFVVSIAAPMMLAASSFRRAGVFSSAGKSESRRL